MPDIRDILPQPPWEGPPIPRVWLQSGQRELIPEEEYYDMPIELGKETILYKATKVKTADTAVELLGKGTYVSPTYEGASIWGRDIIRVRAKINKALLIAPHETIDEALTREGLYPPKGLVMDGLNDWLRARGYDAIIFKSAIRGHDHINIINRDAIIQYGVPGGR
jgi:hypothetical protein